MSTEIKSDESGGGNNSKIVSFDEYTLWKAFKNGDVNAYAVIYQKYFFILFNYGKKLSQDHDLIKDCIQELFIKIWNNRENLNETTSIKYYLFTALKRKLLDVLRKPQHEFIDDLPDEDEGNSFVNQIPDDSTDESYNPQKDRVVKALNLLSSHQQKLLDLKFQKNLSNQEIADELGITIQSVYNAVFKALRSIRKQITSKAVIFLLLQQLLMI